MIQRIGAAVAVLLFALMLAGCELEPAAPPAGLPPQPPSMSQPGPSQGTGAPAGAPTPVKPVPKTAEEKLLEAHNFKAEALARQAQEAFETSAGLCKQALGSLKAGAAQAKEAAELVNAAREALMVGYGHRPQSLIALHVHLAQVKLEAGDLDMAKKALTTANAMTKATPGLAHSGDLEGVFILALDALTPDTLEDAETQLTAARSLLADDQSAQQALAAEGYLVNAGQALAGGENPVAEAYVKLAQQALKKLNETKTPAESPAEATPKAEAVPGAPAASPAGSTPPAPAESPAPVPAAVN